MDNKKIVTFQEPGINVSTEVYKEKIKNLKDIYDSKDQANKKKLFNMLVDEGFENKLEKDILTNRIFELENKLEYYEKESTRELNSEELKEINSAVVNFYKPDIPEKLIERYRKLDKLVKTRKAEILHHLKNK